MYVINLTVVIRLFGIWRFQFKDSHSLLLSPTYLPILFSTVCLGILAICYKTFFSGEKNRMRPHHCNISKCPVLWGLLLRCTFFFPQPSSGVVLLFSGLCPLLSHLLSCSARRPRPQTRICTFAVKVSGYLRSPIFINMWTIYGSWSC